MLSYLRGLVDPNTKEQFVAYFLPTDDTIKKKHRDEENGLDYDADDEYDFKMTREYTWNIKSKSNSQAYDENLYFIVRDNGIFYNELDTR